MRTKHFFSTANIDFISYLPDDIRSFIVSFLPVKDSVASCILSRRWRYVYASSPSLLFDFSLFPKTRGGKQKFISFVESTLCHFSSLEVRKFCLSLDEYGGQPEPMLDNWILFAVFHRVRQLVLSLPRGNYKPSKNLLKYVFHCVSLTHLKLGMYNYVLDLPSPKNLTNLKSLEIKSVSLLKGEFLEELFENCSLLEELVIEECRVGEVEIYGKGLEKLTICNCKWVEPAQMTVFVLGLKSFKYIGAVAKDHCFELLDCLDEVVLNLSAPCGEFKGDSQALAMEVVKMVGNTKILTLSRWCIEQLCGVQNVGRWLKIQVKNVKELKLLVERREDCVKLVDSLLVSFVNLEILSISILPSSSLRKGPTSNRGKLKMKGKMKHLKRVTLEHIDENKTALKLVKFLLQNSDSLEKMTILPSYDGLEFAKFKRKVSKFPIASTDAKVEYSIYA